jgi:hypothetical protein
MKHLMHFARGNINRWCAWFVGIPSQLDEALVNQILDDLGHPRNVSDPLRPVRFVGAPD